MYQEQLAKTFAALMGELKYQDEQMKDSSSHVVAEFPLSAGLESIRVNLNKASEAWYGSRAPHPQAMEYIRKIGAICIRMGNRYGMPPRFDDLEYGHNFTGRNKNWDINTTFTNNKDAPFDFKSSVEDMELRDPEPDNSPVLYVYSPAEGVGTMKHWVDQEGVDGKPYRKGTVDFFMNSSGQQLPPGAKSVHGLYPFDRCFSRIEDLLVMLSTHLLKQFYKVKESPYGDLVKKTAHSCFDPTKRLLNGFMSEQDDVSSAFEEVCREFFGTSPWTSRWPDKKL